METKRERFLNGLSEKKQEKTSKSIITPEGKSIFIEEGKNHIQGATDIVENSPLLKSLLVEGEEPIDLLYFLGYIFVDEGIFKSLMYCSKSLNKKTEERLKKLIKKIGKQKDSFIADIYENLSDEEKKRCAEVLKQYIELQSKDEQVLEKIK